MSSSDSLDSLPYEGPGFWQVSTDHLHEMTRWRWMLDDGIDVWEAETPLYPNYLFRWFKYPDGLDRFDVYYTVSNRSMKIDQWNGPNGLFHWLKNKHGELAPVLNSTMIGLLWTDYINKQTEDRYYWLLNEHNKRLFADIDGEKK